MVNDPYLIPGTDVLRNKAGFRTHDGLRDFEGAAVSVRIAELSRDGLPDVQGFDLLKAIHRRLFQDPYDWAGEIRTVTLAKASFDDINPLAALAARRNAGTTEGHDPRTGIHTFVPPDRIEVEAGMFFQRLSARKDLGSLDRPEFVNAIADGFKRLNEIHCFREGNGRVQQLFWTWLSREAGHPLDFAGITRERMV